MRRKNALPELLAPAGSFEALVAAVAAGADAVYFGGGAFHARALAQNFDREEMARALLFCRLRGVRSHITLNTLLFDRELPEALEYARFLWQNGADAVITADVGLMTAIRDTLPGLEIHASTQAGVHNLDGAEAFARLGASRVVAAREVPREDLCRMIDGATAEVEMFLHGALCVCRSGQCLFSSLVGGRSGNRGLCAQPCRLPYEGDRYLLSLKDLALAPHVPEIIGSGVSSLKIEGRMKSPAYVYHVTRLYRRLLDERRAATPAEMEELARIFCRGEGFTDGYYRGDTTHGMTGVRDEKQKQESRLLTVPFDGPEKAPCRAKIEILADTPIQMTLSRGDKSFTARGECPLPAQSAPLSREAVLSRLSRLGDTPFSLGEEDISLSLGEGLFVPAGQLNALRRAAAQGLGACFSAPRSAEKRTNAACSSFEGDTDTAASAPSRAGTAPRAGAVHTGPGEEAPWGVFFRPATWAGLSREARGTFSHVFVPAEKWAETRTLCRERRVPLPDGVMLPPAVFDSQWPEVSGFLDAAAADGATHALVAGPDQLPAVRRAGLVPLGDFRLNITNRRSLSEIRAAGVEEVLLSPELTLPQAADLGGRVLTWGRIPLMVLERCVMREKDGCAKCESRPLCDRTGAKFPLLRSYPHRNLLFNSLPTYMGDKKEQLARRGLTRGCMLFSVESAAEAEEVIRAYRNAEPLPFPVRRFPSEKV